MASAITKRPGRDSCRYGSCSQVLPAHAAWAQWGRWCYAEGKGKFTGAQLKIELSLSPSGSRTRSPGRVGLAGSLQRCNDVLRANADFGVTEEHGSLFTSQPFWDFWLGFAASRPQHPVQDAAGARGGLSNPSWDTAAKGGAHPRACKKSFCEQTVGSWGT